LPAVGVEAALDDVAVDGDFGVLVTLPQDAAFALLEVGWAPGAVQVVQRDRAGLDVGPYAHFDGAADQYLDVTGSGCGEQLSLFFVVSGLVDEPDPCRWDAGCDELAAQFVVDVPAVLLGGAQVAEHQLERARNQ